MRAPLFDCALHPVDGREINAKLMRQMPAQPERRGLRVKRQSNALAFDILGGADAGARVDEDVAMAEDARWKHRQRHEPSIALPVEADELGRRKLRNIELAAADHAVEHVASGFERDAGQVNAFRPHDAFADRLHAIVAAAREGQLQTRHCVRSRSPPCGDTGQGGLCKARGALARPSPPAPPPVRHLLIACSQRLENWKLRRALALPYFLRSTTRGSRVRNPPRLSAPRRSGS